MRLALCLLVGLMLLICSVSSGTVFEVGPLKPLANIGDVPWESLIAGDTVLIYWRATAYQEKWVICRRGTFAFPITVRGVPGPLGQLPVIDGAGATTRFVLDFPAENRGIIKIGTAFTPFDLMPAWIVIENLDIRNARSGLNFTSQNGFQTYATNAAAIYLEKGQNVTIRNCVLSSCGMGLFAGGAGADIPSNLLVERCFLVDNGAVNDNSLFNAFTESIGLTVQFNRFGQLKAGSKGDNLRDQSSNAVIRYNWIEGGDHQLDLIESANIAINASPFYNQAFVYGNILIEYRSQDSGNDSINSITQFGGQASVTNIYRKGPLFFYNNTVVSYLTAPTVLFNLPTNEQACDARNNIAFVTAPQGGTLLYMLNDFGLLNIQTDWFNLGFKNFLLSPSHGAILNSGGIITGSTLGPGFVNLINQDFHLRANSPAVNRGGPLSPEVLPGNDLTFQYVEHSNGRTRPNTPPLDLGAFELVAPLAVDPGVWNMLSD